LAKSQSPLVQDVPKMFSKTTILAIAIHGDDGDFGRT